MRWDNAFQSIVHRPVQRERSRIYAALVGVAPDGLAADDPGGPDRRLRIARRLARCGREPVVLRNPTTGAVVVSRARCRSRVCPTCSRIRTGELRTRLAGRLGMVDDARFLTLTLASTDEPLRDQVQRLMQSFQRLRRRKAWTRRVSGGAAFVEITHNGATDRWHPHLHVIMDGDYFPQAELAGLWHQITGDSRIVDIRRVPSRRALLNYVTKYVAKSQDVSLLPGHRIREWAEALHGQRMISTFGHLHRRSAAEREQADDEPLDRVGSLGPITDCAARGEPGAAAVHNAVMRAARWRRPREDTAKLARWENAQAAAIEAVEAWHAWARWGRPISSPVRGSPSASERATVAEPLFAPP